MHILAGSVSIPLSLSTCALSHFAYSCTVKHYLAHELIYTVKHYLAHERRQIPPLVEGGVELKRHREQRDRDVSKSQVGDEEVGHGLHASGREKVTLRTNVDL